MYWGERILCSAKKLFLGYLKYFRQFIPITCRLSSFSISIHGSSAKHEGYELKRNKQGAVTYSTDRENEVSKTLIMCLGN